MHPNALHGHPCPYCLRHMNRMDPRLRPTRDHIWPRSRGGREILICCLHCNSIKGNMLPLDWVVYMMDNPGWWRTTRAQRRRFALAKRKSRRQGSAPMPPVVVPPDLVFQRQADQWRVTVAECLAADASACHVESAR